MPYTIKLRDGFVTPGALEHGLLSATLVASPAPEPTACQRYRSPTVLFPPAVVGADMDNLSIIAYIDPGVGSLLMQALVGGGAGLFVFAKYLWRTYLVAGVHRS